jgi:hypothetical protein
VFLCASTARFAGTDKDMGTVATILSAVVDSLACGQKWLLLSGT